MTQSPNWDYNGQCKTTEEGGQEILGKETSSYVDTGQQDTSARAGGGR